MAAEPDHDPEQAWHLTVTTQDLDELAARLTTWLGTKVDHEGPVKIANLTRPQAGGMSSSTILFDASWETSGRPDGGSYVARMAPDPQSFPAFETYDLARQFAIMRAVAANSDVPVPELCWLEEDGSVLGAPFFVMRRVDGRIPEDNPPYVFVGWLHDATPEQRMTLTRNTIEIIAKIHAIPDPVANFPMLATPGAGSGLRAHVDAARAWYRWALADDGYPIPLLDRAFDWLEENWPANPGPDVLSWGDSRPGNIIYREFEPIAVLDWEMAALGPRELDVAWLIFIHRFFQDIATRFEQPGLPDYLRREDVVAHYEAITGYHLRDLDFYLVYAALLHGVIMARIKRRMIHFGEDTDTPDRDDYVMHRTCLEQLLDGVYEWD